MKGSYHISVQNNRLRYEFDIKRNITIIQGESATGKTTLIQMITLHTNLGESSGITIHCKKNCRTIPESDWQIILPLLHDQIIFIDENSAYVRTQEFAEAVKESDNYFILITRESLPNLPYSVEEIYGIHVSGRYHDLKKTYNEFYRIYNVKRSEDVIPEEVITEDSNSGFEFFASVCEKNNISCRTAGGKSNLVQALESADKENVLAVADGAAIGPEMNDLSLFMQDHPNTHLYLPESFEWLILKSGLIDGNEIQEILSHPEDFIESQEYFSWEQFFTRLLTEQTKNSYLHYNKAHLNSTYLNSKESAAILKVMKHIQLGKELEY